MLVTPTAFGCFPRARYPEGSGPEKHWQAQGAWFKMEPDIEKKIALALTLAKLKPISYNN